jgi:hypothetical protein
VGPGESGSPPRRPAKPAPALPLGLLGPFIPAIATAILRTTCRTTRLVEVRNEEYTARRLLDERKPMIFALWHNRMFYSLGYFAKRYHNHGAKFTMLVSASKDGELIARTILYMRGDVVRGSSSRGGREALLGMLDRLRRGHSTWITPDGPRGPRYVAQPGAILVAQRSGLPLVPVTCGVRRAHIFPSWDGFIWPFPFSPTRILYGDPILVPPDADEAVREVYRKRLEDELNALTTEADDWSTVRR